MKKALALSSLMFLTVTCGGGSGASSSSTPPPPVATGTAPSLVSIQPDASWAGQYLLDYLPSSAGAYGTSGIVYIPEVKSATTDWSWPNTVTMGVFDLTKQIPLNLDVFPEGLDLSVRIKIKTNNGSNPSGYTSNVLGLTTLPFPPSFYGGYDTSTGTVTGYLTNNSKIQHTFRYEVSGLDAQGNPSGWLPMVQDRMAQNANHSTSPDDLLVALEFPSTLETQAVVMRAETVSGNLVSIPSQIYHSTLGLAVPTDLTASSDTTGIHLSWTNHSTLATSIAVFRLPGEANDLSGLNPPIANLPPTATQFTDLPPIGGDDRYYLQVTDGKNTGATPAIRLQTADTLTSSLAVSAVNGYLPLLREPSGNLVTATGSSLWESDANGNLVSSFNFLGGGLGARAGSAVVDAGGSPHVIYQNSDANGYHTHHAWKAGGSWQDEQLPVNIGMGSMFCDVTNQLWIVIPEATAGTGPMKFDVLRGSPGSWTYEVITSPTGTVPIMDSTDQFETVHPDGTLSLVFTSAAGQCLLQRHPDGSLAQWPVPFVPAPENAAKSIPVCGLVAGTDDVLRLVRANGGSAPCLQEFDGSSFTTIEFLPLPAALGGTSLSGVLPPVLSSSSGRLGWVLRSGSCLFACIRDAAGWRFNTIDLPYNPGFPLAGFQGESFWDLHMETDPLTSLPRAVVESEP